MVGMICMTAGELKKCLESIPDEAEVGFQTAGHGPDGCLVVTNAEGKKIKRVVTWVAYGFGSRMETPE